MTPLSRIASASREERTLLGRAFVLVVTVRLALLVVPVRAVQARVESQRAGPPSAFTPMQAAWAVQAIARRIPGTHCLARSLALHALLRRGGHASALQIGVKRTGPGAIAAHAWVSCGGQVIGEAQDDFASLGPLSS